MAVVYIKEDFEDSIDNEGESAEGTACSSTVGTKEEKLTDAQIQLNNFFPKVLEDVRKIKTIEPGNQVLPLARIKKIMKLDEDVKMISAEAPLLFAKATEIFIHELTLRAWIHTEDNKRRTLQRNDIAMAISKYDQFDFLIDIVPREELKTKKEPEKPAIKTEPQQNVVYVVSTPQQQQIQNTINTIPTMTPQTPTQTIQVQQSPQQNIMIAQTTSPQAPVQQIQLQNQQNTVPTSLIQLQPTTAGNQMQQLQLVQQVVSPNGEVSQIPIPLTAQQLNMLRAQMGQPIIVQAPQTIFQTQSGQNIAIPINMQGGLFLNAAGQLQQQTVQQQQTQMAKDE